MRHKINSLDPLPAWDIYSLVYLCVCVRVFPELLVLLALPTATWLEPE